MIIVISILIFALLAIISKDLIVAGLQFVVIVVCIPFIFIYQLLKLLFNKGKKANES